MLFMSRLLFGLGGSLVDFSFERSEMMWYFHISRFRWDVGGEFRDWW